MARQCYLDEASPDPEKITLSEVFFEERRTKILAELDSARMCVWISIYRFDDRELAEKLLEKVQGGVQVQIVMEDSEHNKGRPEIAKLLALLGNDVSIILKRISLIAGHMITKNT